MGLKLPDSVSDAVTAATYHRLPSRLSLAMLASLMAIPLDEMLKQEDIRVEQLLYGNVLIVHDSTVHSGRTYRPNSNRIPTGTLSLYRHRRHRTDPFQLRVQLLFCG